MPLYLFLLRRWQRLKNTKKVKFISVLQAVNTKLLLDEYFNWKTLDRLLHFIQISARYITLSTTHPLSQRHIICDWSQCTEYITATPQITQVEPTDEIYTSYYNQQHLNVLDG